MSERQEHFHGRAILRGQTALLAARTSRASPVAVVFQLLNGGDREPELRRGVAPRRLAQRGGGPPESPEEQRRQHQSPARRAATDARQSHDSSGGPPAAPTSRSAEPSARRAACAPLNRATGRTRGCGRCAGCRTGRGARRARPCAMHPPSDRRAAWRGPCRGSRRDPRPAVETSGPWAVSSWARSVSQCLAVDQSTAPSSTRFRGWPSTASYHVPRLAIRRRPASHRRRVGRDSAARDASMAGVPARAFVSRRRGRGGRRSPYQPRRPSIAPGTTTKPQAPCGSSVTGRRIDVPGRLHAVRAAVRAGRVTTRVPLTRSCTPAYPLRRRAVENSVVRTASIWTPAKAAPYPGDAVTWTIPGSVAITLSSTEGAWKTRTRMKTAPGRGRVPLRRSRSRPGEPCPTSRPSGSRRASSRRCPATSPQPET